MLLFGVVPTGVILTAMVLVSTVTMFQSVRRQSEDALKKLTNEVAAEIERGNSRAVLAAQVMAWSQVNSLFGKRIESSEFAREVLQNSPELTGVYVGEEPNADNQDSAYVNSAAAGDGGPAVTPEGRFIPYWFRDHHDNTKLVLEPLVEMRPASTTMAVRNSSLKISNPHQ